MQKILFVSHCILNVASKVVLYNNNEMAAEEDLRRRFILEAIKKGIQFMQLPCPEFTLYGSKRWGHVSNQFDNPFFRKHCRNILEPIICQIEEYLSHPESFEVLGIIGIDGSPSCGVDYTCCSDLWFGSFECRSNMQETFNSVFLKAGNGIFMDELSHMLFERRISLPMVGLYSEEPDKLFSIIEGK